MWSRIVQCTSIFSTFLGVVEGQTNCIIVKIFDNDIRTLCVSVSPIQSLLQANSLTKVIDTWQLILPTCYTC